MSEAEKSSIKDIADTVSVADATQLLRGAQLVVGDTEENVKLTEAAKALLGKNILGVEDKDKELEDINREALELGIISALRSMARWAIATKRYNDGLPASGEKLDPMALKEGIKIGQKIMIEIGEPDPETKGIKLYAKVYGAVIRRGLGLEQKTDGMTKE